jgi:hypothetical protein
VAQLRCGVRLFGFARAVHRLDLSAHGIEFPLQLRLHSLQARVGCDPRVRAVRQQQLQVHPLQRLVLVLCTRVVNCTLPCAVVLAQLRRRRWYLV